MSNALLRRNSSKQGLQNLMRLTAQRSIEDAEEVERERRRRAREASRWTDGGSTPGEGSPERGTAAEDGRLDVGLKPDCSSSLEEDEGFSDWTQRRERRRQQRLQELGQGGGGGGAGGVGEEEEEEEQDQEEVNINRGARPASTTSSCRARRQEEQEEQQEIQRPEVEKMKVSYTSQVFLQNETKHNNNSFHGDGDREETTHLRHKRHSNSRPVEQEEPEAAILEAEQRLERIRWGLQQKESQELEQLKVRQQEAELELEELQRRREERRRVRGEEERRREEEEQQRLAKEEEERRRMKEDIERRRMEAQERMKSLSSSGVDGDETFSPFSPKTPTHKITERTESLNRSLKKSNSFKKTQGLVLLPKIDHKLEQYAHAVENSQDPRSVKAPPSDLPYSPEVVASKKNLFEAGDAWNHSPSKSAPCRDTEGLKVGVAGLITQWVKGPSDSSRQTPGKPTDLKPGDVMQKKNMWEGIRDSSEQQNHRAKVSAAGKKYKFVVTGHGKYEKMSVDQDGGELRNGSSGLHHSDL